MTKRAHSPPDAPRLKAYLARAESRRVLQMPRSQWEKVKPSSSGKSLVNIHSMPISRVTQSAAVIAATAERLGPSEVEVAVYRYDPGDVKPYNLDLYSVREDLAARPDFEQLVASASTDIDDNMRSFLTENVFIVSKYAGASHWLDEEDLPAVVQIAISPKSTGAA